MACSEVKETNLANAIKLVREAAGKGAQIILLQELFHGLYFCQEQKAEYFGWATTLEESELIKVFSALAAELKVVLPISFFERRNNAYFNSIVILDADGSNLGLYRKSHIPDGPGYQEKFYFTPGDTGFKVFNTAYAKIGVAICWDQWFPEAARSMALQGAEILFYPTAIGSEPENPGYHSGEHWERTMVGHSAASMVPVVASNRIGTETFAKSEITFYGSSFITDNFGAVLERADRATESILVAELNLTKFDEQRAGWGLFRDRRPELYGAIMTKDGGK
eukprot:gene18949-21557_t